MIILPAIDIIEGKCVRLTRGDYSTSEQVADDPIETAISFANQGAAWIHMVDLDGAKVGEPCNMKTVTQVAALGRLNVEVGGGIRSLATIEAYLAAGVSRVILGSVALSNPGLVRQAVCKFGEKIAVGIDAQDGLVRISGWLDGSDVWFDDLAAEMAAAGVSTIVYTDIGRDGTLAGPNLGELARVRDAAELDVIASGGIANLSDVQQLAELGLYAAILGKSIYRGTIDLAEAIKVANCDCGQEGGV
jgi:phosphoribosylformimino-5-aminoimidazole carboxamide ribotide isomerase